MNIPAIRAALERLDARLGSPRQRSIPHAVVVVGLRACDEAGSACSAHTDGTFTESECLTCSPLVVALETIEDILREAGVEVEG